MNSQVRSLPIAITSGDLRGIGPEVIAKGIFKLRHQVRPDSFVVFGEPDAYLPFKKYLPKQWNAWNAENFLLKRPVKLESGMNFLSLHPGKGRPDFDLICGRSIELAVFGVLHGCFSSLVTGPIDKNALRKGGHAFNGHTDFIEHLCNESNLVRSRKKARAPFQVTMMMASPQMRVVLVTTHVALAQVSSQLSREKIISTIENTIEGMKKYFRKPKPRIAVLGLNPHAGDQGLFGQEEKTIIEPAIKACKKKFPPVTIDGPFSPDGFFAKWKNNHQFHYDAVVCMYHDQGLIPIKLLDFENAVNVTLGVPLIRTSVDHGVGYDIVGKNLADPSSFCAAFLLAQEMIKNSKRRK